MLEQRLFEEGEATGGQGGRLVELAGTVDSAFQRSQKGEIIIN